MEFSHAIIFILENRALGDTPYPTIAGGLAPTRIAFRRMSSLPTIGITLIGAPRETKPSAGEDVDIEVRLKR